MNEKQNCRESFRQWKQIYEQKLDQKFSPNNVNHPIELSTLTAEQQERKKVEEERQKESKRLFDESQFIEWEGEPLHCSQHTSRLNCNFVSNSHIKCACQKYFGNRKHLDCSCDPSGFFLLGGLTEERCRKKGFLEDDYPKLASR